jgi:membrane protein implicated in regulation of membrane protease activity
LEKLLFVSFALAVAVSLVALAQDTGKATQAKQETAKAEKAATKATTVTGKVSADGKSFVDKESWTVTNPEALNGHEGHEVTLKGHMDSAKNEIHVVSVKMAKKETKETSKKEEKK